jgi:NADPH:quinone reductase-like Zn-dependent oxidoreductase
MKAVVLTGFGRPDVLQTKEVDKPVPKDNEVLIRVRAASVFAGDAEIRGLRLPLAFRLPFWLYGTFMRSRGLILGQELAGDVEAVGKDVTRFRPGDAVFAATGFGLGAYAEYKAMPEGSGGMGGALALKPANLTYAEAAVVPVGGLEALYFIRLAHLQPGSHILIYGAGGSIGTMAVQLAKDQGAEVTAVDRAEKLDMLRAIGANHALDHRREDFSRRGPAYDAVLDIVGKTRFSRSMMALKPNGRYLLGNAGLVNRIRARLTSTGNKRVILGTGIQKVEDLTYLKGLIEAGKLRPVIDRQYRLEQMAEAHRYVDTGRKLGNVAIVVGD